MSADGSVVVGRNDCTTPVDGWRYFSSTLGDRYCAPVANSTGRSALLNVHGSADASLNDVTLAIDLTAVPAPTGAVAVQAGETWNFQAWHRDTNPVATSNFTDAISVMLH